MSKSEKEKAVAVLRNMNLKGDDINRAEIAREYKIKPASVNLAYQNLIFAFDFCIDIDKSIVYAWRWCGDNKYAKIGSCKKGSILRERIKMQPGTFHPTDDIILIGIKEYDNEKEARQMEKYILKKLGRTRCKREWVNINPKFNKLIKAEFRKIDKIVRIDKIVK